MRIFLAGASGVIGTRLVPLLVAEGHHVAGLTRHPGKQDLLRGLGAQPVVADVYDGPGLAEVVVTFDPDLIIQQVTDLPDQEAQVTATAGANARIRREGTRNLLTAAELARVHRFLVQSVAWELPGDGAAAAAEMEQLVLDEGGVVLRYGRFYGPGTYHEDAPPEPPRIHVDEAARRTVAALDAPSGILTIQE